MVGISANHGEPLAQGMASPGIADLDRRIVVEGPGKLNDSPLLSAESDGQRLDLDVRNFGKDQGYVKISPVETPKYFKLPVSELDRAIYLVEHPASRARHCSHLSSNNPKATASMGQLWFGCESLRTPIHTPLAWFSIASPTKAHI
jgi:hypothetical protein